MSNNPELKTITYIQQDLESAQEQAFISGNTFSYSARMPDKETVNEDAAALIPYDKSSGILVVADGVGGIRGGDEAARVAIDALINSTAQATKDSIPLREAILNGIESANKLVIELGTGAATTLAVIELQNGSARPYHVGDSMILIIGQRGKTKFQAIPHSPVGYAVESGLLDESEAVHHEERHIVSNVVGSLEMRIDIGPTIKLSHRDTVILASDGLSDNLYSEEIIEQIRKGPMVEAAKHLEQITHQRMLHPEPGHPSKPDDLTFILYRPN